PFDPAAVIAEAAALLKTYNVREIVGDRYAAGFVSEAFARHGIVYIASTRDRSAAYLDVLPLVNAGKVRLLDDPELLKEFRGLERMRGAGRDRVDHRRGVHDDRSNSAALALLEAQGPHEPALITGYREEAQRMQARGRRGGDDDAGAAAE